MTAPQKEPAGSEREAFEVWAADQGFVLTRTVHGDDYQDLRTQGPWDAWQARASQPSGAAGEVTKPRLTEAEFIEWFKANYYGEVVFSDSEWHAKSIYRRCATHWMPIPPAPKSSGDKSHE